MSLFEHLGSWNGNKTGNDEHFDQLPYDNTGFIINTINYLMFVKTKLHSKHWLSMWILDTVISSIIQRKTAEQV